MLIDVLYTITCISYFCSLVITMDCFIVCYTFSVVDCTSKIIDTPRALVLVVLVLPVQFCVCNNSFLPTCPWGFSAG